MGARWTLGEAATLSLEGSRRESGGDDAEHGIVLPGSLHW